MGRVLVALSGGVDSAVSAYQLHYMGYDVLGVWMDNWQSCQTHNDCQDAEWVCQALRVPFKIVNFSFEYWQNVFQPFLQGLKKGLTPNPDVACNQWVKFDWLWRYAQRQSCQWLATGHYARIIKQYNVYKLYSPIDVKKDQTYFLHTLKSQQLQHVLFPLSDLNKPTVRALAQAYGLIQARKKESMGLCFVGKQPFAAFVKKFIPDHPGPIRCWDTHQDLGAHDGMHLYTLGQRSGLGNGDRRHGKVWYVVHKANHVVYVVNHAQHPALYSTHVALENLQWVCDPPPSGTYTARFRHQQNKQNVIWCADKHLLTPDQPQWAIAPGQSAVLYDGDHCLGGGIVSYIKRCA
jgi:tRNA-uridine 2-sulfurtransferase